MTRPDTAKLREIIEKSLAPYACAREEAMNILDAVDDALDNAEQAARLERDMPEPLDARRASMQE